MATAERAHPNYIAIWVWLAVLTVLEVGVAFVSHLPKVALIVLLVGMAVFKAALVAMYFMHLKFERRTLRTIAIIPLPLAVLLVLVVITEKIW